MDINVYICVYIHLPIFIFMYTYVSIAGTKLFELVFKDSKRLHLNCGINDDIFLLQEEV